MFIDRTLIRRATLVAAVVLPGCASSSNVFERHDQVAVSQIVMERTADRTICPVVVSNATDLQLEAGYAQSGVPATLGQIPAGRSVSFGVHCDSGAIEAFAVSTRGGLLGGGYEYRKRARVEPSGPTRVNFTLVDRVK